MNTQSNVSDPEGLSYSEKNAIWTKAAKALGWEWEPSYNGYIRPDYHPNGPAGEWASYPSELEAEDACFLDGIETLTQAVAVIEDKAV